MSDSLLQNVSSVVQSDSRAVKSYAKTGTKQSFPQENSYGGLDANAVEHRIRILAAYSQNDAKEDTREILCGAFMHALYRDFCDRYMCRRQIYANGLDQNLKFDDMLIGNIKALTK